MLEFGLCVERLGKLSEKQLRVFVETLESRECRVQESDPKRLKAYLISGRLIPALCNCLGVQKHISPQEVLHLATRRTAELIGIEKASLQGLNTQQIAEGILDHLHEEAVQEIRELTREEMDELEAKLRERIRTLEVETEHDGSTQGERQQSYVYWSFPKYFIPQYAFPYQGRLTSRSWQTPFPSWASSAPWHYDPARRLLFYPGVQIELLTNRSDGYLGQTASQGIGKNDDVMKDIAKYGRITALIVAAAAAGYGMWRVVGKIKKGAEVRKMQRLIALAEVVIAVVKCLAYNPFRVLGINPTDNIQLINRSYKSRIKTVHPDAIRHAKLSTDERARANQRCLELNYAYEMIRKALLPNQSQGESASPGDEGEQSPGVAVQEAKITVQ